MQEADIKKLDAPLTNEELKTAIFGLTSGKACGPDGFPVEFWKTFWNEVGDVYMDMARESVVDGVFPVSLSGDVLMVLPKKGYLANPGNWSQYHC